MRKNFALLALGGLSISLAACDVDQTQEAEAPEIKVEEGQLPAYDVEPANVDVSTGTKTVEVPTLDVDVNSPDAEGTPATAPSE